MPEPDAGLRHLWRISNHGALDGAGGLRAAARWHSAGRRIVYLAESPAGAMIEALVHLEIDPAQPPPHYSLLKIELPAGLAVPELRMQPAAGVAATRAAGVAATRAAGDGWLARADSAVLRVPSAIAPETWNVLLNPVHAAAAGLRIVRRWRQPWDARLLPGQL